MNTIKKIAYMSLGCKVNLYESVAIINQFLDNGFELVDFNDIADVYIINTCTVTQTSDAKSRKMIRQAIKHNTNAIICVMGCFAQLNSDEVLAIDGVNVVCGSSNRHLIYTKVIELLNNKIKEQVNLTQSYNEIDSYEDLCCNRYEDKTRGFVKIQDGCENFCSYCAIPYSRGKFRSRHKDSIIKEIQALTNNNMKEIVLTGINTGAYGKDLLDYSFPKLLLDIISEVKNIGRIRISSIEATEVTDELIDVITNNIDHFCLHLHIPLQGGTDEILKLMNRKYDTEYYKNVIDKVKNRIPDINITADILVGFNGESNELFTKAYDFINMINYGETHVFPYSPRPKTKAYLESKKIKFADRVDSVSLKYRVNELLKLNEVNAIKYRKRFEGGSVRVIVEKVIDGIAFGHSSNYLEVQFVVNKARENDLVDVLIETAGYPVSKGVEINVL